MVKSKARNFFKRYNVWWNIHNIRNEKYSIKV